MERAFNRPLGALPRLPPFLPPSILELLAEVAVMEEEMVRLEEHIAHCRQELYQETAFTSSLIVNLKCSADVPKHVQSKFKPASSNPRESESPRSREPRSVSESRRGKENNLSATSIKTPIKKMTILAHTQLNKSLEARKLEQESHRCRKTNAERSSHGGGDDPNKISEDLVKCLSNIFMRMSSIKRSAVTKSQENDKDTAFRDPYGICSSFSRRDIGPYKNFSDVEAASVNQNRTSSPSSFLIRQLKRLLGKLSSVNLQKLNQQEKLAFWTNIYNSCMMNCFLEHGIPESPDMVTLTQKATINVGGHFLNASTIEHFILRLPYHSKYISPKGSKKNEMAVRSKFGLELSEPLVTFALSCGTWSSPAVRVYTASKVEEELEVAKREYLEASVGISVAKMGIPKLMDWYSHDFAKDIESLLDWICLQLPTELGKDALNCVQQGMSQPHSSTLVHIIPYDFTFRYLFSI
ncbi:Ternary complex factor MIP1 leucine-zipper [Arabidopsis thaliana x Arabidopsis arenosa]|nr:Ternary complex factor MIP1 leucine-zipper [Arabidopsis thaliana x Arabidopsis arenosa]